MWFSKNVNALMIEISEKLSNTFKKTKPKIPKDKIYFFKFDNLSMKQYFLRMYLDKLTYKSKAKVHYTALSYNI